MCSSSETQKNWDTAHLQFWERNLNSAMEAAKAAGGRTSPWSDIMPDIRRANSVGPGRAGVHGAEEGSRTGGGS